MAIYSVFCFGTNESQTMAKNNIITQFSLACTGPKSVIDGPKTLGWEVSDNADKGVNEILAWLKEQPGDDNSINLTGFSRGSVTLLYIANRLKKMETDLELKEDKSKDDVAMLAKLQGLKLHIYAIDPVAGLTDKSKLEGRVIPSNVKSYVALLQMDEMRRDFKPQDQTRVIVESPHTKVSFLPMYGNHSDNTKIKKNTMQAGPTINWYSLYSFMTQHGSKFKDNAIPQIVSSTMKFSDLAQNPTRKDLLKLFQTFHEEREHYLASGTSWSLANGIPIPKVKRSFNKHLDFYVKNADFFVNQLERELFKVSYPKVFNYLFEKNRADPFFPDSSHSSKQEVLEELEMLREETPALFARLSKRGVHEAGPEKLITVGKPRGIVNLESCGTLKQMFPHFIPPSQLQATIHDKLVHLETDVYRMTFRYEREKSEFSPFTRRSESARVRAIRHDVNVIICKESTEPQVKQHLILDILQKNLYELVQKESTSALVPLLQQTLKDYGREYTIEETSTLRGVLADCTHALLALLKETIVFVGSMGYIGGGIISLIGNIIGSIGSRINDLLLPVQTPLKYPLVFIASLLEVIGIGFKEHFGIKPLVQVMANFVQDARDNLVSLIGPIKIEPVAAETPVPEVAHETPVGTDIRNSREVCRGYREAIREIDSSNQDPTIFSVTNAK